MNTNKNICFLAISKGSESKETAEIKRYIGIGACKVVGFNPTKAQIKELMGYEPNEEPVYVGTQDIDGKQVKFARISIVVRTIPEKCNGIKTTQMLTFFLRNQYRQSNQKGTYQVGDEFGRTAWATKDVIEKKGKIFYKEGTMEANITQNYTPFYAGQAELVDFLIKQINIASPTNYVNGAWVMKPADELEKCHCALEKVADYFKGDFSELYNPKYNPEVENGAEPGALQLQPNNVIKVLFGIRTSNDGREYQDVYSNMVLRANVTDYSKIQKEIEDRKNAGALSNRTYEFTDLHEYKVEATNFNEQPSGDMPFDGEGVGDTPW